MVTGLKLSLSSVLRPDESSPTLTGPNTTTDPRFDSQFSSMYTTKVPFYICAGNHDYKGTLGLYDALKHAMSSLNTSSFPAQTRATILWGFAVELFPPLTTRKSSLSLI